jgi:hypothetical protein
MDSTVVASILTVGGVLISSLINGLIQIRLLKNQANQSIYSSILMLSKNENIKNANKHHDDLMNQTLEYINKFDPDSIIMIPTKVLLLKDIACYSNQINILLDFEKPEHKKLWEHINSYSIELFQICRGEILLNINDEYYANLLFMHGHIIDDLRLINNGWYKPSVG